MGERGRVLESDAGALDDCIRHVKLFGILLDVVFQVWTVKNIDVDSMTVIDGVRVCTIMQSLNVL